MTTPSRLFKYFPPERASILRDCEIAFSRLSAFNDPFEGNPDITSVGAGGQLLAKVADGLPAALRERYDALPSEAKRGKPFELVLRAFHAANAGGELQAIVDGYEQMGVSAVKETLPQVAGVCCLCEEPDNQLMWAHYGSSHSGFVLEFDAASPFFESARRVAYRSRRPSGPLVGMEAQDLFLTKGNVWAYELEWRMLRLFKNADRVLRQDGQQIYLFRFPPEMVKSVIFGARATPSLREAMRDAARSIPGYAKLSFREAFADKSDFLIRIRDV